jgi:hypothetical protein
MSVQFNAKKKSHVKFLLPKKEESAKSGTPTKKSMPQVTTPRRNNLNDRFASVKEFTMPEGSENGFQGESVMTGLGEILTYFCPVCNLRHFFHEGDIVQTVIQPPEWATHQDGSPKMATGTMLEDAPPKVASAANLKNGSPKAATAADGCMNKRKAELEPNSESSSGSDDDFPDVDYSKMVGICCAEKHCFRPDTAYGLVTCYDCMGDFHLNDCGDTVILPMFDGRRDKTRHICRQCLLLCCCGREVCKHPGQKAGRVTCVSCRGLFHKNDCGGGVTRMRISGSSNVRVNILMCYACRYLPAVGKTKGEIEGVTEP